VKRKGRGRRDIRNESGKEEVLSRRKEGRHRGGKGRGEKRGERNGWRKVGKDSCTNELNSISTPPVVELGRIERPFHSSSLLLCLCFRFLSSLSQKAKVSSDTVR
jgi:hypothetical protein